ncbi:MAG: tetratricopeptide repeat protein [Oleispira sp.]
MKYFKYNMQDISAYVSKTSAVLLACLLLVACATKQTAQPLVAVDTMAEKVELLATEQYLPVQAYDETQQLIPYQAKENPYLAQKKQVDKGSVLLFIEAQTAWRNGDSDTAKQKLNVIIRNDKGLSGPWMILGDIALAEKDSVLAQKHYQQGLLINPNNVNGYTALAQAQRIQGQYNRAQNTLAKALGLWSDFPEAHYNLSILFDIYLNQSEKAKQHLNAYILLEGGDQESQQWLQQLSERSLAGEE